MGLTEQGKKPDNYKWILLAATSLAGFGTMLNMSVFNVVLPAISSYFQASSMETSWVILSYQLFLSVMILVFGRLSDIYGRRRFYLLGSLTYTITSLLCALSPTVQALIVLRVFQAAGAAMIVTTATPLVADAFPKEQLSQALGISNMVFTVSYLAGPVLGGWLTVQFGWQTVFLIMPPMTLLGLVWGFFKLKAPPSSLKRERIDMPGNLAATLGLGGIVVALSVMGDSGFMNVSVFVGIVVFVVCLAFFLRHMKRTESPVIDVTMFENSRYAKANITTFLNAGIRAGVLLLIGLQVQYISGSDPAMAGLIVLPMAIGTTLASPVAGVLAKRMTARTLSSMGLLITIIGTLMILAYMFWQMSMVWLIVGESVFGIGIGIFQVPNTTLIMLEVPIERRGIANGIRSMSQNLGKLLAAAIAMMLITALLPASLKRVVFQGGMIDAGSTEALQLNNGFMLAMVAMLVFGVLALVIAWSAKDTKALGDEKG